MKMAIRMLVIWSFKRQHQIAAEALRCKGRAFGVVAALGTYVCVIDQSGFGDCSFDQS